MNPQYHMENIQELIHNPVAIQNASLTLVEQMRKGEYTALDSASPFVTLMGINAANVAAAINSYTGVLRKQYSALSSSPEELYHHMSDKDYRARFANPFRQKVMCFLALEEVLAKAVEQPDGSKKLTIRQYSNTTVDGTTFTLLYPVVIKVLDRERFSIRYDVKDTHPLHPLLSDTIYWTIRKSTRSEDASLLQIELEMVQTTVKATLFDINPAIGLNKTIAFDDQFAYARVWMKSSQTTNWHELGVTHSEMVYDPSTPTAVLKVLPGSVQVRIPLIYFTQRKVQGKIRVDVFSCKGEVLLNATGRDARQFTNEWGSENYDPITPEEAALRGISSKFFIFTGIAQGGTNALSFETLRKRVIDNAFGPVQTPVSHAQIKSALEDNGYVIRTHVDTITDRQFLASKPLPASRDRDLITAGAACIEPVIVTKTQLKNNPWVNDHGLRMTITPSALFKNVSGVTRPTSESELTDLMALPSEDKVGVINNHQYRFTPFYYILDFDNHQFKTRVYDLDSPKINVDRFIAENETTGMLCEIGTLSLTNETHGYTIRVSTLSNKAWKEQDVSYKHAQLSFTPAGIGSPAAINATWVGQTDNHEDIFEFKIHTSFDVDASDKLSLKNFLVFSSDPREVFCDLEQKMRLSFISSAPMPSSTLPHAMDSELVGIDLPIRRKAIQAQMVDVVFGQRLKHLWHPCRTLASGNEYQRYDHDVFETYEQDIYEINPETETIVFTKDDGSVYTKLRHAKGDPVLDQNNQPVVKHAKGDLILDSGSPIPVNEDNLQRQMDMLFLEGGYYFANDISTQNYTKEMVQTLTRYITEELPRLTKNTLDKTTIYFYPKVTMGHVKVLIDAGVVTSIDSAQSLQVKIGTLKGVQNNPSLKREIEIKVIETIDKYFANEVISVSELTQTLKQVLSDDVLSVSVSGLAGSYHANAMTMVHANERISLKKKVVILDSGEFTVREDVAVEIFEHKPL